MTEGKKLNDTGALQALAITGMTCGGCVAAIKRVLQRVPGVSRVEVDLAAGRAQVAGAAASEALIAAVESAGYGARVT